MITSTTWGPQAQPLLLVTAKTPIPIMLKANDCKIDGLELVLPVFLMTRQKGKPGIEEFLTKQFPGKKSLHPYDSILNYAYPGRDDLATSKEIIFYIKKTGKLEEYQTNGKSIWLNPYTFWSNLFGHGSDTHSVTEKNSTTGKSDKLTIKIPTKLFLPVEPGLTILVNPPKDLINTPGIDFLGTYIQVVDTRLVVTGDGEIEDYRLGVMQWTGTRVGHLENNQDKHYKVISYKDLPLSHIMWNEKFGKRILQLPSEKDFLELRFPPGAMVRVNSPLKTMDELPDIDENNTLAWESFMPRRAKPNSAVKSSSSKLGIVRSIQKDPTREDYRVLVELQGYGAGESYPYYSFELLKEEVNIAQTTKTKLADFISETIEKTIKGKFFQPRPWGGNYVIGSYETSGANPLEAYRQAIQSLIPPPILHSLIMSEQEANTMGIPKTDAEFSLHIYNTTDFQLQPGCRVVYEVEGLDKQRRVDIGLDFLEDIIPNSDSQEVVNKHVSWLISWLGEQGYKTQKTINNISVSIPPIYHMVVIKNMSFIDSMIKKVKNIIDTEELEGSPFIQHIHQHNVFLAKKYFDSERPNR